MGAYWHGAREARRKLRWAQRVLNEARWTSAMTSNERFERAFVRLIERLEQL